MLFDGLLTEPMTVNVYGLIAGKTVATSFEGEGKRIESLKLQENIESDWTKYFEVVKRDEQMGEKSRGNAE